MKGFMKDDKFHPIRDTKGVRKSRDQSAKTVGIKIERKARTVSSYKLPVVNFSRNYWGFETDDDGKIMKLRLGNWVDAGWHWDGDEDDILGYLIRINHSKVRDEFIESMEEAGADYMKLKPLLIKKVEDGSWLYEMTGDNNRWHFHGDIDEGAMVNEEFDYFKEESIYSDEELEKISDEMWNQSYTYEFEDFQEDYGDEIKKEMKEMIKTSDSYKEFFEKMNDENFQYNITENYVQGAQDKVRTAIHEAVEKLKKSGEIHTDRKEKTENEIAKGSQKRLS